MKFIGPHVSICGGIDKTVIKAHHLGANAFALFTKNKLAWYATPLKKEIIKKFKENCIKYKFGGKQIIAHNSYITNLGSPNNENLKKSRILFLEEIVRCYKLGVKMLNFHPGNHMNLITISKCLLNIADSINFALSRSKNVIAVIENTAGQGTSVGYCFEQIAELIEKIENKKRIGVCLDTCHAFSSGYDLRDKKSCDKIFRTFEKNIGLKYLKAMHLNDSKNKFHSYKDRHQNLGKGYMGSFPFNYIKNDIRFVNMPLILETPNNNLWIKEINWIKNQKKFSLKNLII